MSNFRNWFNEKYVEAVERQSSPKILEAQMRRNARRVKLGAITLAALALVDHTDTRLDLCLYAIDGEQGSLSSPTTMLDFDDIRIPGINDCMPFVGGQEVSPKS